jgi:tRNA/rRNA methyltransferase
MISPPIIILVAPQMGENIGAAARAMGNFGLSELRIVTPRDGWPNKAAEAMAAHALPIIEQATLYESLAEAVADCQTVYATSARQREMNKPTATPKTLQCTGKTAILFGRENNGLTNEELCFAHCLLTIPVHPACPSLNLAQAVLVTAYEWFQGQTAQHTPLPSLNPPASQQELTYFLAQLEPLLDHSQFWKVAAKKEKMWQNIRTMLYRAAPSSQEVQTLHGIMQALKNAVR